MTNGVDFRPAVVTEQKICWIMVMSRAGVGFRVRVIVTSKSFISLILDHRHPDIGPCGPIYVLVVHYKSSICFAFFERSLYSVHMIILASY